MADLSHLDWPFFDTPHRALAQALDGWCAEHLGHTGHDADVDAQCRQLVRQLGEGGWLRHAVAGTAHGGATDVIDTRAICLARETLARHSGLADFAFAMQGLGSGAITLAGTPEQQARYLRAVASGEKIAAFALSEPQAGSDVAAMALRAQPTAEGWQLDGEKTWETSERTEKAALDDAIAWLKARFPEHENPLAYWSLPDVLDLLTISVEAASRPCQGPK